jgi:NAD(P)-dependent dehydrogenase (short-subunit alcohol dehydrogenase family)
MRAQGNGLIILTTSTAGLFGYPLRSPYATAKWGLVGLTKTLAGELGPAGVRVNAIAPGAVEGDRMERVLANESAASGIPVEELRQTYVKGVSMKTWVNADDLADMALFLASPAASKISGQIMAVDGHTESLVP